MADVVIGADAFAATVNQMLGRLETNVNNLTPDTVEKALKVGESEWKKNAKAVLSTSYSRGGWGKSRIVESYKVRRRRGQARLATVRAIKWYGRVYKTGKYARSIRHQLLSSGAVTEGEIGSASMPGLAHLLEKGHATLGGGGAAAHVHIAPAAETAFRDFENYVGKAVEEAINAV